MNEIKKGIFDKENKKSDFLADLFIVSGIVIFFVSIFVGISNYSKQEFTITRESCEEKPQYSYFDFECEDGSSGRVNTEQLLSFFNNSTEKNKCNFNISIDYETICQEEEVDEDKNPDRSYLG